MSAQTPKRKRPPAKARPAAKKPGGVAKTRGPADLPQGTVIGAAANAAAPASGRTTQRSTAKRASKGRQGSTGKQASSGRQRSTGKPRPAAGKRSVGRKRLPARRSSRRAAGPGPAGEGSSEGNTLQRLQKVLAAAGAGSRRQCEELILTGRVEVDRRVITELGTRVDPVVQEVRLDGVPLAKPKLVYYALNKPVGVVSTSRDPSGRPRVIDLVPSKGPRLFCVGRLDLTSEGLILVTNDGKLADRLTHPRYEVDKIYRVQVAGRPTREVLTKLHQGVRLAEATARAERIEIKSHHKESTILEMVLREGHNREIRRVLAAVGHKVLRLVRIGVGPVRLGDLGPGESRMLTHDELKTLREAAGVGHSERRQRRSTEK